jgi:hypothetical protein
MIMNDDEHTLKWMSGSTQCTATYYDFADTLGYLFEGPAPLGARFFSPERPNKDTLFELYTSTGQVGTITGLLPHYDQLQALVQGYYCSKWR